MIGLSLGLGLSRPVAGAAAPPSELFPDPTLVDVADGTDGWQFSNGFPTFGPKGGTGPGIQALNSFDDDGATLKTALQNQLTAAITPGAYTVIMTFANVVTPGTAQIVIGDGFANYTTANGAVSHPITVTSGADFTLSNLVADATYDITGISVKRA